MYLIQSDGRAEKVISTLGCQSCPIRSCLSGQIEIGIFLSGG
jgi:hypothetical protein